jgi:hypothetical protein
LQPCMMLTKALTCFRAATPLVNAI